MVREAGCGACEQKAASKSIHPLSGQAVHGSVGLPVAVQCVALPWEEELCLRFMKEVETLARNHRGPE